MNYLQKIIVDFELQSVEGIKECFENGISPNDIFNYMVKITEENAERQYSIAHFY
jgi:hypothetical protein